MRELITEKVARAYYCGYDTLFTEAMDREIESNKILVNFTDKISEMKYEERTEFLLNGGLETFIKLLKDLNDKDLLYCYKGQCCQAFI